jgi:hypothetical protein
MPSNKTVATKQNWLVSGTVQELMRFKSYQQQKAVMSKIKMYSVIANSPQTRTKHKFFMGRKDAKHPETKRFISSLKKLDWHNIKVVED